MTHNHCYCCFGCSKKIEKAWPPIVEQSSCYVWVCVSVCVLNCVLNCVCVFQLAFEIYEKSLEVTELFYLLTTIKIDSLE